MTNNPLLGKLLSEHKLADYRRTGLIGCGVILIVPFICGIWSLVASLTDANQTAGAEEGFYFSIVIVVGTVLLFGFFALLFFVAPVWQKKYGLKIYENGFVKKDLFKTQTCLWSEIREVNPMLLDFHRHNTKPSDFRDAGEDTGFKGIYEVYKQDGSKITVSRKYTDIERLDERLSRYCRETPNW